MLLTSEAQSSRCSLLVHLAIHHLKVLIVSTSETSAYFRQQLLSQLASYIIMPYNNTYYTFRKKLIGL